MVSERKGSVAIVAINRPEVRNAVDQETAKRLLEELKAFDSDPDLNVAVLHGTGTAEDFETLDILQCSEPQTVHRGPDPDANKVVSVAEL